MSSIDLDIYESIFVTDQKIKLEAILKNRIEYPYARVGGDPCSNPCFALG